MVEGGKMKKTLKEQVKKEQILVKFNRFGKKYLADRIKDKKGKVLRVENIIPLDFWKEDRYNVSANFMDLNPPQYPFPRPIPTPFNESYINDLILTEFNKEVEVLTKKKYKAIKKGLEDNKRRME